VSALEGGIRVSGSGTMRGIITPFSKIDDGHCHRHVASPV
jgi:hypothetical protein